MFLVMLFTLTINQMLPCNRKGLLVLPNPLNIEMNFSALCSSQPRLAHCFSFAAYSFTLLCFHSSHQPILNHKTLEHTGTGQSK